MHTVGSTVPRIHPPPPVSTPFYRYDHVPAGGNRIRQKWVRHTVRAVVDRDGDDVYQLVVRHWAIKRGWVYEILSAVDWSFWKDRGVIWQSNVKPTVHPPEYTDGK